MFRREIWQDAGGYNSNMIWGFEDWDFWLSCGERGLKPLRIPESLLLYRVKDSSMFTEAMNRFEDLRARIVLNHPKLYEEDAVLKARTVWSNPKMPLPPGAPKVSVIVPAHNRPVRLAETLQSIVGQTMKDFEIIVVNDHGIDVEAVVDRFRASARIVSIRHHANRGLAAARNTGLHFARGHYVAYLDDDDIFLPDHLQTLVEFLESTGNRAAYSDAWCAEEELSDGAYRVVNREIRYSSDWDNYRILVQNLVPVLCFVHERSAGIATGDFDEELTTHEDWDYWIRLSRVATPVHIKKVTCEFRTRSDGSSMTSSRRADFLRTARIIYKRYQAYVTGKDELREQQKKFLQGLERELDSSRAEQPESRFGTVLRRIFRRNDS